MQNLGCFSFLAMGFVSAFFLLGTAFYAWYVTGDFGQALVYFLVVSAVTWIVDVASKLLIMSPIVARAERVQGYEFTHESQMPDSINWVNGVRELIVRVGVPLIGLTLFL